jgi:hypothetical protein
MDGSAQKMRFKVEGVVSMRALSDKAFPVDGATTLNSNQDLLFSYFLGSVFGLKRLARPLLVAPLRGLKQLLTPRFEVFDKL